MGFILKVTTKVSSIAGSTARKAKHTARVTPIKVGRIAKAMKDGFKQGYNK
jgi:hypothetical protein